MSSSANDSSSQSNPLLASPRADAKDKADNTGSISHDNPITMPFIEDSMELDLHNRNTPPAPFVEDVDDESSSHLPGQSEPMGSVLQDIAALRIEQPPSPTHHCEAVHEELMEGYYDTGYDLGDQSESEQYTYNEIDADSRSIAEENASTSPVPPHYPPQVPDAIKHLQPRPPVPEQSESSHYNQGRYDSFPPGANYYRSLTSTRPGRPVPEESAPTKEEAGEKALTTQRLNEIVSEYLQKKGYVGTDAVFEHEASEIHSRSGVSPYIGRDIVAELETNRAKQQAISLEREELLHDMKEARRYHAELREYHEQLNEKLAIEAEEYAQQKDFYFKELECINAAINTASWDLAGEWERITAANRWLRQFESHLDEREQQLEYREASIEMKEKELEKWERELWRKDEALAKKSAALWIEEGQMLRWTLASHPTGALISENSSLVEEIRRWIEACEQDTYEGDSMPDLEYGYEED
ncbi:hypothetical protein BJ508DRAFT_311531 [Ascobolus immersus RN42]|uniref:Uncharacterized protein n=1 Tax=Ascobolus immersus RN42 TaxID=1160509 RepID=A0A3N4HVM9_ASCIM|nr:hypothetical protein BJ508DRAFT_311531 [Ascobolus immersus RN42]